MRQKIVAGNWKMNGQLHQVVQLTNEIKELLHSVQNTHVVIMPPSIYIPQVKDLVAGCTIALGGAECVSKRFWRLYRRDICSYVKRF
ncbi:triosephosphate isomerase [Legionella sainthelensi]|nr:triosephosphate isomerase [Legionella sainthelensi]